MNQAAKDAVELIERINNYLHSGGLFNPELANHDAVRDLLRDCRPTLELLRGVAEGTHEIRPKRRDHKTRLRQIAGEPVDSITLIIAEPSKFKPPRNDNGE